MEQKKFMDIERVKFASELVTGNNMGFEPGDEIVVQEKVDGSNASIRYDVETDSLVAFSRKQTLDYSKTLNGFWNYVQSLNADEYKDTPSYVIFGEWMVHNHIHYTEDVYKRWIVYDIYDTETQQYLAQNLVKEFCDKHNLEYIHVLYTGKFTSWNDLIEKFAENTSYYCDVKAEGFIVKNQTKLNNPNSRTPFVLKIVNDSYSEINKSNHIRKIEDPQKLQAKAHAQEIVDTIVTKRRVEKEIRKMIDEQLLPKKIEPKDMSVVARSLPKRIYDDCVKEEVELVREAGEFFGKLCGAKTMNYAKEIILGQ